MVAQDDLGKIRPGSRLDPLLNRRQHGLFFVQLLVQARNEMRSELVAVATEFVEDLIKLFRAMAYRIQNAVGPKVRHFLLMLTEAFRFREALQSLQERQAQHERKNPQLRYGQRNSTLVRHQEADNAFRRHAVSHAAQELGRDVVNPHLPWKVFPRD